MADTPHFRVPFQLGVGSHALVVEQDSDDDVLQCCAAIIRTPRGSRLELTDFGIADTTFIEGGPAVNDIAASLRYWEPRADTTLDITNDSQIDQFAWTVKIGVLEQEPPS